MAVTVEGATTAEYSGSRSPSFTFSVAPIEDDVIVVAVGSTTAATMTGGTDPTDWTNALGPSGTVLPAGTNCTAVILTHVVTAAEDAADTVTWTLDLLWSGGEAGGVCATYLRGVDLASVIDAFGTNDSTAAVTPHALAAVSGADITATGGMVWRVVAKDSAGDYATDPAGHTRRASMTGGTTLNGMWLGTRDVDSVAATNIDAVDITPQNGDQYVSATLVITPAATGEEHSTTGTVTLALATDGDVAKTAGTTGGIGLALTVADDAVKLAEVVGALALGTTIDADVAKIAAATGAMALALELAGDVDKLAAVAGSLGLALDLSGVVDADSSIENTVGTLALALAIAATATKTAGTTGALPVALGVAGTVDKEAATVGAIGLQVAATGQTAKTAATVGALPLVLTLVGLVDFVPPFVVGTTTATARGATTTATAIVDSTTAATIAPSTTATEIAA